MKAYLEGAAIQNYIAVEPIKAGLAERFNRTLKTRLYKYFNANQRFRWLDILPKFVKAYNEQPHTSLKGMAPADVTFLNQANVYAIQRKDFPAKVDTPKFAVGDRVRRRLKQTIFTKGYSQNFSSNIFTVSRVLSGAIFTYRINDDTDRSYYSVELVPVLSE